MTHEVKSNYYQPAGLSALQLALQNIIRKRIEGDEIGAFKGIRDFALITTCPEIIEKAENIAQNIENKLKVMRSTTGITVSETYSARSNEAGWLEKENYNFLKAIMCLCDKHNITVKHGKELPSNRRPAGNREDEETDQLFE